MSQLILSPKPLLALSGLIFLAACAQPGQVAQPVHPRTAVVEEEAKTTPTVAETEPAAPAIEEDSQAINAPIILPDGATHKDKPKAKATEKTEKPKVAALPKVKEIKVDSNPDQFLGASTSSISNKMGKPIFIRRDGGIEVWQYRRDWDAGQCHLDLFLYPDSQKNLKVKFADLRSAELSDANQVDCFSEMLRDHIRRTS